MRTQETACGVVGSFADSRAMLDSVKRVRALGMEVVDVYSPIPLQEVADLASTRSSPIRFATFIGAIVGLVAGLALAIWSSVQWDLIVGGKPVTSIIPFLVVGFEIAILFGALFTLLALLVLARLPVRGFPSHGFRPEFTNDRFGVHVKVRAESVVLATQLLREAGAVDVHELDGHGSPEKVVP